MLCIRKPHIDYIHLLEACIQSKSLLQGKLIHQHLLKNHITTPTNTQCSQIIEKLTHFYLVCNNVVSARHLFDESPQKPKKVLIWNMLIRAYAWNGPFNESISLYFKMLELGIQPSKFTYPFVLKACSALQAIEEGKEIHFHAKRLKLDSDVYVATALVDMYAKCGCLEDAEMVFNDMNSRDVVAWNSMIAGFSLHGGYVDESIRLLIQMQEDFVTPNSSTMVAVLPLFAQANLLSHGKAVHGFCVRRGYIRGVVVATGLLDMYGKCRFISYARRIFDTMGVVRNEVTWSAMLGSYVICDLMREALDLFQDMMRIKDAAFVGPTEVTLSAVLRACAELTDVSRGRSIHCYANKLGFISDLMFGNTLLSTYAKCGIVDDTIRFFHEMEFKDEVSYNAIISGCVQNGNAKEALSMFCRMRLSGMDPDSATMIGVIPACAHLAALQHGSCCHSYAIIQGFAVELTICNALIDMYAKCGRVDTARRVFDNMHKRDIVTWNSMIFAYGNHGLGMEALNLFDKMLAGGLEPDDVTFICVVSACSHSGLVTEGQRWFNAMRRDFDIIPRMEHYVCMVDLLSRAGYFDEVHNFIKQMPFEPDVRIWSALLSACKVHNNIKLGEEVSKKIQKLGHESTGNFVLLSNMYSTVGRWHEAAEVRITQKDQGFMKSPGCSWIEIGGVVHAFIGGDTSHPQSPRIKQKLTELLVEMKKLGYKGESTFVFHDVEEEEKEQILLYHSEKLAIAFGILSLSPNKSILVTKNLRVCGDCHAAIKLISLITKRDITVRDASRFHHFRNGICNCGDFW
ncbi:pentatricopeptide repeat-containing protein At3g16610 [Mercurialis annua]|uniref:pentatricopeptide repeat-containing protein At3g16610 n=1 Tax=Mercurialis annua TaxID=3986 RepID=UPI002160C9D5|nr:pentatricopeptide repeat-containing protein At3g16610 [Mercurialis annua]